MVKKMSTQTNTLSQNIVETLSQEFNGDSIYGVEFIVNELPDNMDIKKATQKDAGKVDWFGFSDLSI